MKLAIIETGGKQYLVYSGKKIQVEKLDVGSEKFSAKGGPASSWDFDKVLLFLENDKLEIGKPYLENKKIEAEIIEQKKLSKVNVFRYHSKTRYRKKKGHRQSVTEVKVV